MGVKAEMGGDNDKTSSSCDEMLDRIWSAPSWKSYLAIMVLIGAWLATPTVVYMTAFAGINPTSDNKWTCISKECMDLVANNSSLLSQFPCKLTKEVDGKTELLLMSSDIEWEMSHSSFAVDFDLNCDVGSTRELKTLLSSIFFAGALTGLIVGGYLFDHIGRKRSALVGYFIAVVITLLGTFCHNYYFLLAIRFFQGIGCFLIATSMYILTSELLPAKYRNYANGWAQCLWALGYPIASGVGYFVKDWNYMFLAAAILLFVFNIQVFFCIESPRYYLMKGDAKSAKKSIEALAALAGTKFGLENTELVDLGKAQEREQSFWQQVVELCSYPGLLLETSILMFLWFFLGMSYYGFNFGWGSIVPNRYLGYLGASVGELIAYISAVPLIARIGRRRAMMLMFVGAALFYLIAIPEVKLGKNTDWTLESVSCLIGVIFISGCFSGVYLWTAELAPTSHRGFVFCVSSSSARIGSFMGPYIFNNLKHITHKAVPLGGLAVLALLCALGSFILVETGDKETALTGEDVVARRKSYRYRI
ncbi:solute carrier family 22 member 15-like isoform X2 [Bolinopsis microptera]|uniref:solute carrier family 22 member 15-like isoform X2 n=1 Tax=Bolinopsis microptera TaxID=2820187 RepID=UPI003079C688